MHELEEPESGARCLRRAPSSPSPSSPRWRAAPRRPPAAGRTDATGRRRTRPRPTGSSSAARGDRGAAGPLWRARTAGATGAAGVLRARRDPRVRRGHPERPARRAGRRGRTGRRRQDQFLAGAQGDHVRVPGGACQVQKSTATCGDGTSSWAAATSRTRPSPRPLRRGRDADGLHRDRGQLLAVQPVHPGAGHLRQRRRSGSREGRARRTLERGARRAAVTGRRLATMGPAPRPAPTPSCAATSFSPLLLSARSPPAGQPARTLRRTARRPLLESAEARSPSCGTRRRGAAWEPPFASTGREGRHPRPRCGGARDRCAGARRRPPQRHHRPHRPTGTAHAVPPLRRPARTPSDERRQPAATVRRRPAILPRGRGQPCGASCSPVGARESTGGARRRENGPGRSHSRPHSARYRACRALPGEPGRGAGPRARVSPTTATRTAPR